MRISIILLSFVCLTNIAFSQGYFQQEVNYKIDVKLNDVKNTLSGFEELEYINNSPDTLTFLYFHLWPNAYKNHNTALAKQLFEAGELDFYYSKESERGYIDSLKFKIDGESTTWSYDEKHIDICKINLPKAILPGQKVMITTPFFVKIPVGKFSRLGHLDQAYAITQWYPKPAVYDKNGWNQMPYLNQGEFYSEFGSFDVKITLPKNYVVASTGDMVDGEEEQKWLEKKVEETNARGFEKGENKAIQSEVETKTLRYKQSNVHDFAWFADKRYLVLSGEVELPNSKRKVKTWTMFTPDQAKIWQNSIEYINDATFYYSKWNGDYPYNQVTAVYGALEAGGGMEYPNVTVIGASGTGSVLETVIMHEVGHNWFYGILGSNERVFPWMDEGLNSYNENRYMYTKYPNEGMSFLKDANKMLKKFDIVGLKHSDQYYLSYLMQGRKNLDQPVQGHSADYSNMNYGAIVYGKSALIFDYLKNYLGEEAMDKAMQHYFETWKFKHPQPEDFKKCMEESTGKNLDWFFENMVNTTQKYDYKISSVKEKNGNVEVSIKNRTGTSIPFSVTALSGDSAVKTFWVNGFDGKAPVLFPKGDYTKFVLDYEENIPEINRRNNRFKTKGLLRRTEKLRIQYLFSIENPKKTHLYYTPMWGWNGNDGNMLGMAFYNTVFPSKKLEWAISPMYGLKSKRFTWLGFVNYHMYPQSSFLQKITLGVGSSSFGEKYSSSFGENYLYSYQRIVPSVNFKFRKKNYRSFHSHQLGYRVIGISHMVPDLGSHFMINKLDIYRELKYTYENKKPIHPYSATVLLSDGKGFVKAEAELNYRVSFKKKGKGLDFRVFAGKFLINDTGNPYYNFRMDGQNGEYDYQFDHLFLHRNGSGFLAQQSNLNQGGFVSPAFVGQSNSGIVALNSKLQFPIGLPLGLFGSIGYNSSKDFVYEAGIYVPIVRDMFEIYFPLMYSQNIIDTVRANDYKGRPLTKYLLSWELIRFNFNISKMNPFKTLENLEL